MGRGNRFFLSPPSAQPCFFVKRAVLPAFFACFVFWQFVKYRSMGAEHLSCFSSLLSSALFFYALRAVLLTFS
jgi:hypothetical protein